LSAGEADTFSVIAYVVDRWRDREARYLTASGANGGRTYDASPDGKRFLMIKGPSTDTAATPPAVILVQHWDEDLKHLVPTK